MESAPATFADVLEGLGELAAYDGPWRPLRDEAPLLRERLRELRERAGRLDDLLVVALVGGSGVGKSTLLNALAGDLLAETSEFRPCTAVPTVYHPPGADVPFQEWHCVSGSALEHLVLIDTPDSDTIEREHRETVIQALSHCDLIMVCGSPEKYLDEATWSLLRPIQNQRAIVCVETKADLRTESVRDHWLARMQDEGFEVAQYFRLSARRTLDRKLAGQAATPDELDFAALEAFLHTELTRERIGRIKRSNVSGLLNKTLARLQEQLGDRATGLGELSKRIDDADEALAQQACAAARRRLFGEPHLWTFALGREVALRAKGILGALFRLTELMRSLPARFAGWLPWSSAGRRAGHQAAQLLASREPFSEDIEFACEALERDYGAMKSELQLALAQAGFATQVDDGDFDAFLQDVRHRLTEVLRGPAREHVTSRARLLTSWPATFLYEAPLLVFLAFAGYRIVRGYFLTAFLPGAFLVHTADVFAIIAAVELFLLSLAVRLLAWGARTSAARDLSRAMANQSAAFRTERAAVDRARGLVARLDALRGSLDA